MAADNAILVSQNSEDAYQLALVKNRLWASKTAKDDPALFPKLATGQHPEILWIGCSDSRCPETAILGLQPGDVFVHRNIANVIHYNDMSSSSVIEYAVVYLQVKHIVLCGHTSCGGIAAALANKRLGLLDTWLMPLRHLREQNLGLLSSLGPQEAAQKLAEINVRHGLRTLKENSVVLDAIEERGLELHGVLYDVASGILRELDTDEPKDVIQARIESFKTFKPTREICEKEEKEIPKPERFLRTPNMKISNPRGKRKATQRKQIGKTPQSQIKTSYPY